MPFKTKFEDSKDFNISLLKSEEIEGSKQKQDNDGKSAHKLNKACKKEYLEETEQTEVRGSECDIDCAAALEEFDLAMHDAWVLQCPKGMRLEALAGKRIKMPGRRSVGELQVRATPYAQPLQQSVGFANERGKWTLRRMPLAGHMIVSKRVQLEDGNVAGADDAAADAEFPKPSKPQKFKLPVRHPFFGRDYQERIALDKKTTKQLRQADKKSAEATLRLRSSCNFYKLRSKLLATTQTLEQKEHDVRQSVITGVLPKFMLDATAPPTCVDLTNGDGEEETVEQQLPKKKRKSKANGVEVKETNEKSSATNKLKKRKTDANEEETAATHKKRAKKLKSEA